jgi:hypothetical protein
LSKKAVSDEASVLGDNYLDRATLIDAVGGTVHEPPQEDLMRRLFVGLAASLLLAAPSGAVTDSDHLKCYKVADPQAKAKYTADLGGLIAEPGCTIKVPAVMACIPATKTNVSPDPPGRGGAGTVPNAFGCYKVKCSKASLPAFELNDHFGNRVVRPKKAKLLCAPATPDPTLPTCTCGEPGLCGSCGGGSCAGPSGCGATHTPGNVCFNDFTCSSASCTNDAQCPSGQVCITNLVCCKVCP